MIDTSNLMGNFDFDKRRKRQIQPQQQPQQVPGATGAYDAMMQRPWGGGQLPPGGGTTWGGTEAMEKAGITPGEIGSATGPQTFGPESIPGWISRYGEPIQQPTGTTEGGTLPSTTTGAFMPGWGGQPPPYMPQPVSTGRGGIIEPRAGPSPQMPMMGPGGQAPQAGGGEFPYPQEWQTAGDMYSQMIQQKGMPIDVSGYGEKLWGGIQTQAQDLTKQLAEQAGMGVGSRYSSPFFRNVADVGARAGERFGLEMAGRELGAQEAGMGRMFGAGAPLAGIGSMRAQLPLQVSQTMMGLGGQQQQMQQQEMDRMRQEFMRTQPEYNPLMGQFGQGAQLPLGPEMYSPSLMDQMMGLGSKIIPFL